LLTGKRTKDIMADIIEKKRRAPGAGAKPGERRGGRRPGSLNKSTAAIKDLAERLGVDPVGYFCAIIKCDGAIQVPVIDPATGKPLKDASGQPVLKWEAITLRQKLDAAKELLPYTAPKLAATQVTGANEGPVKVATLDITQVIADPELARAAQEMALLIADQQSGQTLQLPRPYDCEQK